MFSRALVLVLAVSASLAGAAHPYSKRQLGNLQCNINRLDIVNDVSAMGKNIADLASATASDPTSSSAVANAQAGLQNCTDGISTIAKSIFALQKAPSSARDQVAAGLETIGGALSSINSTDPSVSGPLSEAQSNLAKAIQNGENVVADCK